MISYVPMLIPITIAIVAGLLFTRTIRQLLLAAALTGATTAVAWVAIIVVIQLVRGDVHDVDRQMILSVVTYAFGMGIVAALVIGAVRGFRSGLPLTTRCG